MAAAWRVRGACSRGRRRRTARTHRFGRATEVLLGGARQQYFLLFQPPRFYDWLTEEGMRADSELSAVLDAYSGEKGGDPSATAGWSRWFARAAPPSDASTAACAGKLSRRRRSSTPRRVTTAGC